MEERDNFIRGIVDELNELYDKFGENQKKGIRDYELESRIVDLESMLYDLVEESSSKNETDSEPKERS